MVIPAKAADCCSGTHGSIPRASKSWHNRRLFSSSKYCKTLSAMISPKPSMESSSSFVAASTACREPNRCASSFAALSPILRIPRPNSSAPSSLCLDFSSAERIFSAFFFWNPSSPSSSSLVSRYRSAGVLAKPVASSCSHTASPSPSISIALRLQKWIKLLSICAGQLILGQRIAATSGSRTSSVPQEGQWVGSV